METNSHYPFPFTPLPYNYDALEPYISAETLHFHHDKHLKKYLDTLNEALRPWPEYHSWSLERLLLQNYALPYELRRPVSRNAGGVYNHELYFAGMSPRPGAPSPQLLAGAERQFGSFEQMRAALKKAAMEVFGSGYAMLCRDCAGELSVLTTANQSTPLPMGYFPVLNCDVWEHAYYLDVQNERERYVDNWFRVADWARV